MSDCTNYSEIINSFHSSFQDKVILPDELEKEWFLKAVGCFEHEVGPLVFDQELIQFDKRLDRYVIDYLALSMKKLYQERELSRINKRLSFSSKDLSIDEHNGSKTAAKNELDYILTELERMKASLRKNAQPQEVL